MDCCCFFLFFLTLELALLAPLVLLRVWLFFVPTVSPRARKRVKNLLFKQAQHTSTKEQEHQLKEHQQEQHQVKEQERHHPMKEQEDTNKKKCRFCLSLFSLTWGVDCLSRGDHHEA